MPGICIFYIKINILVRFTTTILQFGERGEKTGWSYIKIPGALAQELKPGNKKSFRVKGSLDDFDFKGMALLPMGDGDFIMALNAGVRKSIGKNKGAKLTVGLEMDNKRPEPPSDLIECLKDEPAALDYFNKIPRSHQLYWGNWIKSAKTEATRANRIVKAITALSRGWGFAELQRFLKGKGKDLAG